MSGEPSRWAEVVARRVRIPDHVVHRAFADEIVLLNIRTGTYHGLDRVASRFLETIAREPNPRAAVNELAARFDQPRARIEADFAAFVLELADRGLVVLDGGAD